MSLNSEEIHHSEQPRVEFEPRINEVAQKFLLELEEERQRLEENFPLCSLLIDEAIDRVYTTGRIPGKEYYADVYKQKPIKITQKVFVPIKQYPKFNFTGKILGPKGNSLRRLQEETQCRIVIKGRNSVRDRNKEEEMRNSGDPRYTHLHKDLFVEISTVATPAEGYARVAYALAEIRKYLVPDKNDEVSHEQLRELMEIDPKSAKQFNNGMSGKKSVFDRQFSNSAGAPKFLNLIKQSYAQDESHEHDEHEEELYHYEPRPVYKRSIPPGYEYAKERTVPSSSVTYKRHQAAPAYATEMKRVRETPPIKQRPSSFGLMKKI